MPTKLPFKIKAQTRGVQKAYKNFTKEYGREEGTRIFLQKAEEQGTGKTLREKVNSIYKKGGHLK